MSQAKIVTTTWFVPGIEPIGISLGDSSIEFSDRLKEAYDVRQRAHTDLPPSRSPFWQCSCANTRARPSVVSTPGKIQSASRIAFRAFAAAAQALEERGQATIDFFLAELIGDGEEVGGVM
jgi:hypothetical protein